MAKMQKNAHFTLMLCFFFTNSYNIHFKKVYIENIGIKVYFLKQWLINVSYIFQLIFNEPNTCTYIPSLKKMESASQSIFVVYI